MIFNKKKKNEKEEIVLDKDNMPKHIGLILDGNGRWATKRGLPRTAGHTVGADNLRTIIRECNRLGVESVTAYVFSTENWRRSKEEVEFLMNLFGSFFDDYKKKLDGENIVLRVIGAREDLSEKLLKKMVVTEEYTKNNTGAVVNLALNYGSREELTRAMKTLARETADGIIKPEDITADMIESKLYTAGQPDVDLLIRTSGELRISNFLMWQISYAELWFTDKMWPDFKIEDLHKAIYDFQKRKRRFGGV